MLRLSFHETVAAPRSPFRHQQRRGAVLPLQEDPVVVVGPAGQTGPAGAPAELAGPLGEEVVAGRLVVLAVPRSALVTRRDEVAARGGRARVAEVDAAEVHEVAPFPGRVRRLVVEAAHEAEAGFGKLRRRAGEHVDDAAEGTGPVEGRAGPLDQLDPLHLGDRDDVPLDVPLVGRQRGDPVEEQEHAAAGAAAVPTRTADADLAAHLADPGQMAQGPRQAEGVEAGQLAPVGHRHADRRFGEELRPAARRDHDPGQLHRGLLEEEYPEIEGLPLPDLDGNRAGAVADKGDDEQVRTRLDRESEAASSPGKGALPGLLQVDNRPGEGGAVAGRRDSAADLGAAPRGRVCGREQAACEQHQEEETDCRHHGDSPRAASIRASGRTAVQRVEPTSGGSATTPRSMVRSMPLVTRPGETSTAPGSESPST